MRRVLGQSEVHIDVIQPSVRWRNRAQSVGATLLLWQGEAAKRFVDIQWWLNYTSTAVLSGMASLRSDEQEARWKARVMCTSSEDPQRHYGGFPFGRGGCAVCGTTPQFDNLSA